MKIISEIETFIEICARETGRSFDSIANELMLAGMGKYVKGGVRKMLSLFSGDPAGFNAWLNERKELVLQQAAKFYAEDGE